MTRSKASHGVEFATLLHRLPRWKEGILRGGVRCFRVVTLRVPCGLHTLMCTTTPLPCDIKPVRKARPQRSVSGPQAVGEESWPQEAEKGEQRAAEPVPERPGAHRGEPQPEGGPGPRAEPLAHRLQDPGCLSRARGRGQRGEPRPWFFDGDAGLPASPRLGRLHGPGAESAECASRVNECLLCARRRRRRRSSVRAPRGVVSGSGGQQVG